MLYSIRGIVFCTVCGAFAAKKCRLLANACNLECSVSSLRAKDKLMRVELPSKSMRWPRLECHTFQPIFSPLVRCDDALAHSPPLPIATDAPLADQTVALGYSVGGEPCSRMQVSTSHFDSPELDFLMDESFFDA